MAERARRKLLVGLARPNVPAICLRNERASYGMFSKRVPPNRGGMAVGNFDAALLMKNSYAWLEICFGEPVSGSRYIFDPQSFVWE